MGISLTKILAGAGISTAANALFPGIGMADAFARTAGMGMGNGLMRTAVSPSGSGGAGAQNRFGGPGSPQGAMPTRSFGSTRETVGELKSGFKDWLVDPLQAKKEKREQARDTALAVRLGITGGEYSLTHRPAMSLIKKRTGDVQTNLMILQFRVQQFMARNLSAIASTLGVSKSKIGHEQPDPNKSWFGQILSSLHKDLQQNPIFSTVESVGKHAINIGRILNPFTLGSRAKKGVKSFGEFMQRLAMGKEGFEMMKDPEKLYEKAGLKQDFQTKSVNLMKINNEYQKHQLNMLYNILGATKEMLGIFGGSYQNQKLDLTHDEFEGTLKTHRQLRQAEGMRAMRLETTMQAATRKSIVGRIGSLIGGARNIGYNIAEIARPSKATKRDLYALDYLFNTPGFFESEVRGVSDDLDAFINHLRGRNIDWYNKDNAQLADQFKFFIERAIEHPKPGSERQARQLEESWNLVRRQSRVQVSLASTNNTAGRVANVFRNLTGYSAANSDPLRGPRELRSQYETYTRFGGDRNMAGISVGSGGERAVNEYHNTGIIPAVLRSVPFLGAIFGAQQQMEISGLQNRYERSMRSPYQGPDEDKIFGYGQGGQTGRTGGGIFSSLKVSATLSDIDDALLTKLTNKTINVKLVGVGGNVLTDITPIMVNFFNALYAVGSQLVKDFSKMFDERRKQNKAILIEKPKDNYIDITANAHGNVFSGGDISDYSGKIVDRPTFFRYDSIHKFAKGAGVMGETGDPEGVFPLARTKNGELGLNGPSFMKVVLVDINGNPLPISMPAWFQNNQQNSFLSNSLQSGIGDNEKDTPQLPFFGSPSTATKLLSWISGDKSEEKKAIDYNDNTTTTAERQQAIEDKRERKEEERREQEQQAVEEDKKSTLHRIADLLDPRTAVGKLVDKYRAFREKKKEEGFKLPFDISSWISKLGIGLIGNELIKMLPEGFFTGENGLVSKVGGFVGDVLGWMFDKAKKYVEENAFDWFKGSWEHFKEHPLLDAGILMTLFPGTVGKLLVKVAGKAIMNPASIPSIIGVGGMVYNLIDSFSKSKDENGEFSLWKFLKEFFIGSESNLGSILGKAGTYGFIGARIGALFGGVGALPGFLIGGAIGSIIGSLNTKDEKGEFSLGEFFKSFFLGKNSAGGLANGAGNAIKWGFIGAAIGIPFGGIGAIPGFLLGAALGGIIGGITGYLGYDKLETGSTVSKLLKWKSGSFAYKLANFPGAQFPPFIGPFIFGTIGTILDLSGDLFEKIFGVVNDAWMWLKKKIPFLGDDDDDEEEIKPDEITKKAKAAAEAERSKTVKYQHENGTVLTVKATGKEARYIEAAKTPEERRQRVSETRRSHIQEDRLIEEARAGKKKYDIKKYVELKRKWEKEDAERNEKYSHEIDIPVTNFSGKESVMGFNDFKSTKENAEEYQKLMNEKKDDDAIRFAKGIKAKQDEEDAKRKSQRDAALKKIEVGSSPDDLKLDAQRKASSVPAAMSAKLGVGDDDDNDDMGSNVDVTHLQEATQKGMNEWVDQYKPSKETQERIGTYITQLKEKAKKGTKEWIDKYNEWNEKNKPSKEEQARINAYNKAASEIDLSSAGLGTSAPGPEPVTPEKDKKKEEIPLYRRPENIAKYNAAAQNIDLSSAGLGLSAPGPDPSSVPAVAKASEDASKKKDENKGKSGSSGPAATPAAAQAAPAAPTSAPVETSAPAAPSGETPASTPSGGGELNWIEKLISNTIQGAFKFGDAVANAAKTAYNTAQQTVNGGPGGGGEVGSWGGGFSNAEYLPGKPGAASLGTHFITAKPKDPGNRPGRNNNPLNVKLHKLGTDKADDKGHRIFGNVDDGIRGNFWQLQRYINGTYQQGRFGQLNTARKIIPVWAPAKDGNNPTAYLQHLQQYGVDIDAPIDLNSPSSLDPLAKLMSGMAREEGWGIINPEEIKKVLTYGNHQGAPGTAQSTGEAAAAPTSAPEAVRNYLAIMGKNAQGARYDNDLRNKPGYYDCSSFTARSLADAGIFPRSVVDGKNAPTTGDLPIYLKRYGFKFHPYNFRGVKTAPPELQPGDILTANKAETGGSMGHVVTYWGDNKIIAAHRKRTNPEVGIKPFYTSKQGGYWRYSPGGGSNPEDLLNKTGQTTTENAILPNSAKTPSLFKKLKKTLGSTKLSWPTISSKVNSDYGTRDPSQFAGAKGKISRTHGGVDIQAAEGDPVYATMSGTVVGTNPDYGTIEVQHPNGWLSKYLHLGKFIARAGEQVKSGQIIGEAGGVGKGGKTDAFNPHLHFELIKDKTKIPPLPMVAAAGIDKPTKREQLENSNAAGYGGPEFTPRINKQMNEYFENNGVGGPEISVKSDNRVIVELKKLQMIMIGVMKAAGKPSIAVSAPQEQGDPKSKGVDGGKFDNMTENMFSQLGGMLGDLNVATTGLGTQIA